MREKAFRWGNILAIEMNHWVIFTAVISLWVLMGGEKPPVFLWGMLSLVPVSLFLIRRYADKGWLLWGGHLALIFLSFMGLGIVGKLTIYVEGIQGSGAGDRMIITAVKVMFVSYIAFCVIYSLYLRLGRESRMEACFSPLPAIGIIFVSLFVTRYQGKLDWDGWYIVVAAVYLCIWLLQYYIRNYLKLVSFNRVSVENLPEKHIFVTGVRLLVAYISVAVTAFLLLLNSNWAGKLWAWIKQCFSGRQVSQITDKELREEMLLFTQRRHKSLVTELLKDQLEIDEEWRGLNASDKLVLLVVLILLVCVAVRIVILIKEKFYLYRRGNRKVEKCDQEQDIREKCIVVKVGKEKRNMYPFLNPAGKIRYICKRYIQEHDQNPHNLLKCQTIREWSKDAEREKLADIYEKARYSGEDCTKADVKQLKIYLSGH